MTTQQPTGSIDMTAKLFDQTTKEPIRDPNGAFSNGEQPELTLGAACAHALHASTMKGDMDPAQKWARAMLAEKVREHKAVTLSAKETTVICEAVGAAYAGMVIMQIFPAIDPNRTAPELK